MRVLNKKDNGIEYVKRQSDLCKRVISGIFQFTCFLLAGYMVYVQIKAYCANRDISITTYKDFENLAQDIFPTLTICARSWNGRIFNSNKIQKCMGQYSRKIKDIRISRTQLRGGISWVLHSG